ncbi:MAG TPA: hypothetical protein VFW93_06020 [Aquabacterium sp.]|uniref:hypothetical protein n=1 Tax=Aquabacterium sp. TaxID=1872578 RepID=UPI002E3521D3|nr:hypothetical protein [Aquabacterium sp.]HEX5355751.1 hypothetical protein [Aquabacterium sp.]
MSSTAKKEKVSTFFRPIKSVTVSNIKQMYDIYASYYENTSLDIFLNDLSKKSGVILVTRKSDDKIVGFSTQTFFDIKVDGKRVRGIFSGDTIIEQAYWGNNALANTFYRRLIIERIKRPFTPFYWFLISKGYKTYLLMTNNFYNYYPKVDGNRGDRNERYHNITQAYCEALFPEAFDKEAMLLDFGQEYVRLKGDVADITPELKAANPHIAFFEKVNPTWRRGTEVPCLAACDYESLFRSIVDVPWKWIKKHMLGTHKPAGLDIAKQHAQQQSRQEWLESDADQASAGSKAS